MRSMKIIILLIIGYMIIFPSSLSAELSEAQFEIIKIAYMNGYANAIKADLNTIKILKQDSKKLKEFSQISVDRYIERVAFLNRDVQRGINSKKAVYTGSNSLSF
ncbi:MAG: hypothetical protein PVG39_12215 [Desulfobacteraceae bacterium]|jgi:hypothetical protein